MSEHHSVRVPPVSVPALHQPASAYRTAHQLLSSSAPREALEVLEPALTEDPGNTGLRSLRAWAFLQRAQLQRAEEDLRVLVEDAPDLTGLRFALFGLGDRIYEATFNRGGEIMAQKLIELGAQQVHEHARHDGSSNIKPKAQAEEWAQELTGLLAG